MTKVVVLIPVLRRPSRVVPVVESIAATSSTDVEIVPLFLVSPRDRDELHAIDAVGAWREVMTWPAGRGDYARKMNLGARLAVDDGADFVFLGADDLSFWKGWAEIALDHQRRTDVCVVGTNDLGNGRVKSGLHATHSLVHRDYIGCGSIDATGLLHVGYHHNFVDDEFVATARFRETFFAARDSIVEHLHPDWGKGPVDQTYEKGKKHFHDDRRLYDSRCRLFDGCDR